MKGITPCLREKVGRLFFVCPEALDRSLRWESDRELPAFGVQALSERMREGYARYPVGGVVLFGHNIAGPDQLQAFTAALHALPGRPLVCIDEEGGRVARIAGNPAFDVPRYESMGALGAAGEPEKARQAGTEIGRYLRRYGIDIDFAPVADVNTNPQNPIIGTRAFSPDPSVAAQMAAAFLEGLESQGVRGCLKHFPGHGDTRQDSHLGFAQSLRSLEELRACELLPFRAGIEAGARLVMTAHIALPAVTGSDRPSTLCPEVLQGLLRQELGYRGAIITDALEMGAITQLLPPAEAALQALRAGADIVLKPQRLAEAFDAVLRAVEEGTLDEALIDKRIERIEALRIK